ncbi:MAG: leucyl/phenylalanyl-tRNA--protein transferase [Bacteroidales bacterium]|nr:leucyl/phenylalanyl-tRNA--protein transferase [Bacteroidales bacterium]
MVVQLDNEIWFPNPRKGEEDGFFAIGGDLSVERLVLAYSNGIFPWYAYRPEDNMFLPKDFYNDDGTPQIRWYCPMQRFVIFPNEIHISHSMRTLLNKEQYVVTMGEAFDRVIHHCGALRDAEAGAWLGPHIVEAYTELHKLGLATSVEVWDKKDELVGGLYGVNIGKNFVGESMFSLVPSGSKVALIHLALFMQEFGRCLIDCQLETPHLRSMGGRFISYDEYMGYFK